jgi:hypothetical protein
MNWNVASALTLVVSSAAWITTHVATCWGLWQRSPDKLRLVLLVFPPTMWLAVSWAFRAGLRKRAVLWVLSAAVYLVTALFSQW